MKEMVKSSQNLKVLPPFEIVSKCLWSWPNHHVDRPRYKNNIRTAITASSKLPQAVKVESFFDSILEPRGTPTEADHNRLRLNFCLLQSNAFLTHTSDNP